MEPYLTALRQPEYLHVVLNHIPIIGLAAGLFTLLVAAIQKSRATSVAAFLLILVSSLIVFPVAATGEKSVDRVEGLIDRDGRKWLHEHGSRADRVAWIYYVTAGMAGAGLLLPLFRSRVGAKTESFLRFATLLCGTAALCGGTWTASAGGKIMHREFRYAAPSDDAGD